MAGTARMERTAAVDHAEVEVASAKTARGADVNFMVLGCLNKSEDARRNNRVAFIFHVLAGCHHEVGEGKRKSKGHQCSISAAITTWNCRTKSVRGVRDRML